MNTLKTVTAPVIKNKFFNFPKNKISREVEMKRAIAEVRRALLIWSITGEK